MTHVGDLLDYQYWARDRVLSAAEPLAPEQYGKDMGSSFPSVRATLNHMYGAEWIWYERCRGTSPTAALDLDSIPSAAALGTAWSAQEAKTRSFFQNLGDDRLHESFEYRLLNGTTGKSTFWEVLHHLVNHTTYHRGQVTTMLRQLGAKPPQPTDLIAYYRQRGT